MDSPKPALKRRILNSVRSRYRRCKKYSKDTNLYAVLGILLLCASISTAWKIAAPNFFQELWPEFSGLAFDIFFVLIVFAFFENRKHARLLIERQQEIISDYKKWNSDEAKFRIAGAIRRMNREGIASIDFGGIELHDFSFIEHDIKSIRGSTFYDGTWGEMGSRDNVVLEMSIFLS